MRNRRRLLTIVLLLAISVALAGCVGGENLDDTEEYDGSDELDHPYGSPEIDIYIDDSQAAYDVDDEVTSALTYWESNAETYLSYNVSYTIVENEADADKILKFTEVDRCGKSLPEDDEVHGCADLIGDQAPQQVNGEVKYDLARPQMERTIKHELGHMLGLTHADEPAEIMQTHSLLNNTNTVNIYIGSGEQTGTPHTAADDIEAAFTYFNDHPDKAVDGEIEYQFVENSKNAQITINYRLNTEGCHREFDRGGSCLVSGEYSGQHNIQLANLDSEVTAWHVAVNLAPLYLEEIPEDLETTDYHDRRNWPS